MTEHPSIRRAYAAAVARDPAETGFLQALEALYESLDVCLEEQPRFGADGILERLGEPEKTSLFPIVWRDGRGVRRQARGFFVQYCTALGPCQAGLVFRRGLDMAAVKALALEDTLEKSLAGLPLGGGLIGADVSPAGMGDRECRRFCRSFMEGVFPLLPPTFHPSGWAGQAPRRELGFLTGQFERLQALAAGGAGAVPRRPDAPMTRQQAAGHGLCRFAEAVFRQAGSPGLEGQTLLISGLDGPAPWAGEKAARMGAQVLAIGDGSGCLFDRAGLPVALLQSMAAQPGLPPLFWAIRFPGVEYRPGPALWDIPADAVFLCDSHTRLTGPSARQVAALRPAGVFEGVPRACTASAGQVLSCCDAFYAPAIASGAGGTVMAYRQQETSLTRWEADRQLRSTMEDIFHTALEESLAMGRGGDLSRGARAAAFRRIAASLLAKGV